MFLKDMKKLSLERCQAEGGEGGGWCEVANVNALVKLRCTCVESVEFSFMTYLWVQDPGNTAGTWNVYRSLTEDEADIFVMGLGAINYQFNPDRTVAILVFNKDFLQ